MPKITLKRLRSILNYDPKTGVFVWKVKQARCIKIGQVAGRLNGEGYINIQIDRITYLGHRLAWFYVYGAWPSHLDHENIVRSANSLSNLRICTGTQNQANKAKLAGTSSAFKGVTWNKSSSKWQASIKCNRKSYYLGLFDDEHLAHLAYCAASQKFFGQFARAA